MIKIRLLVDGYSVYGISQLLHYVFNFIFQIKTYESITSCCSGDFSRIFDLEGEADFVKGKRMCTSMA